MRVPPAQPQAGPAIKPPDDVYLAMAAAQEFEAASRQPFKAQVEGQRDQTERGRPETAPLQPGNEWLRHDQPSDIRGKAGESWKRRT